MYLPALDPKWSWIPRGLSSYPVWRRRSGELVKSGYQDISRMDTFRVCADWTEPCLVSGYPSATSPSLLRAKTLSSFPHPIVGHWSCPTPGRPRQDRIHMGNHIHAIRGRTPPRAQPEILPKVYRPSEAARLYPF